MYFLINWPGSCGDSDVFKSSKLFKTPEEFLDLLLGEYGIADAGYALEYFLCTPYKQPAASIPVNKIFNDLFSIPRTIVERCIGSLKSRFRSLRGIRTPIREEKDFKIVIDHIIACLTLHNILVHYKDDDFKEDEDPNDILDDQDIIHLETRTGTGLREKVQYN